MGQHFSSEPVVDKETERDHNDQFNVAVSSCQGWRMSQEDNHCMLLELPGEHKAAFFAVFDGHGSARVSKHASESLWRHLVIENDNYAKGNFKQALEQAFLTFDQEVNESYNAQLAGTTAVCLLIVNETIYCANIGDSRAVASVNCKCVPLSYDHKPDNPQELRRILAAGGYVLGNRVNGNLALSRAFGDFHYKGNHQLPPEMQIVSPYPDLRTLELNDDLDFLIIACDGIWDVLSSEEAVDFVIARLEEGMEPGIICEQLTTRCLASDYELVIGCDNMTVLLVCYTKGKSWADYCAEIYARNLKRLGDNHPRVNSAATKDEEPQKEGETSTGAPAKPSQTVDKELKLFDKLWKELNINSDTSENESPIQKGADPNLETNPTALTNASSIIQEKSSDTSKDIPAAEASQHDQHENMQSESHRKEEKERTQQHDDNGEDRPGVDDESKTRGTSDEPLETKLHDTGKETSKDSDTKPVDDNETSDDFQEATGGAQMSLNAIDDEAKEDAN